MNDYNVVEQRNNKSPTHFEKEPIYYYGFPNLKLKNKPTVKSRFENLKNKTWILYENIL